MTHLTTKSMAELWAALLVTALSLLPSEVRADLQDGLVLYYQFEGSGNEVRDNSGHGHVGKLTGSVRTDDSKFGKGVEFPDPQARIWVRGRPGLVAEEAFSVAFWINPTVLTAFGFDRVLMRPEQYNVDFVNKLMGLEVFSGGAWN